MILKVTWDEPADSRHSPEWKGNCCFASPVWASQIIVVCGRRIILMLVLMLVSLCGNWKKKQKKQQQMARPTKKRYNRIQKWCPHLKKKKRCSHPFHRTNCMGIDGGNSLHHTHLWPFSTRKTSALGELIWMLKVTLYLSLYFKSLDGTVTVSINCCHLWQEESYLPLSCQRSTFSVGVSRPWHAGIDGGQDTISAQTCLWSQCMPSLCWAFLLS